MGGFAGALQATGCNAAAYSGAMPYVRRDAQGALLSLHRQAEPGAEEWRADDDADVQVFVGRAPSDGFDRLDADFIRVLEDLIDVLIRRQVINLTDLPSAAQQKLYSRKGHRVPTALSELNLLGEAGDSESVALQAYRQFPR